MSVEIPGEWGGGEDLPDIKNPTLTSHKPEEMATATLFFCQMAMLEKFHKHMFSGRESQNGSIMD